MALHRLDHITMGVPNVNPTQQYYADFGLTPDGHGGFSTVDGGEQLRIVHTDRRRLVQLRIAADDADDVARIASALAGLDFAYEVTSTGLRTFDPSTEVAVEIAVAPRMSQPAKPVPPYNAPGNIVRANVRADGVLRENVVRPRKLGHVVLGSTDQAASERFFTAGIGLKVSDRVPGQASFMRCSTDHHNILVQQAPLAFLHHSSWQVEDVDEVGRGATAMLSTDPGRHVWGLGRHHIGSNFFWYLKDPAGNFSEYYSDLDCIVDDQLWTAQDWSGMKALWNWGPPPPASFLDPEDLAAMMTGAHATV